MAKETGVSKVPFTSRLQKKNLQRLRELAKQNGITPSALMDKAVEEFLDRHPMNQIEGAQSTEITPKNEFCLDSSDMQRVVPVIEAIGNSVSLSLFLEIIRIQRAPKPASES